MFLVRYSSVMLAAGTFKDLERYCRIFSIFSSSVSVLRHYGNRLQSQRLSYFRRYLLGNLQKVSWIAMIENELILLMLIHSFYSLYQKKNAMERIRKEITHEL